MQAQSIQLRHIPALTVGAALLSEIGESFRWAFAMHRACREWERSGRRLDGDALQQIAASVDGEPR